MALLFTALAGVSIATELSAQTNDLSDLETRLQKAKKAESTKQEEATKRDRAAAAEKASKGTLLIEADEDCILSVDGDSVGPIKQQAVKRIAAGRGAHLVQCSGENGKMLRQEVTVTAGEQSIVHLTHSVGETASTAQGDSNSEQRERSSYAAGAAVGNSLQQGREFLQKNRARHGVVTTASGLQYEIIVPGNGMRPSVSDTVKLEYTGTKIDGTKFDSSNDHGGPATFPLSSVIPGLAEALQLMPTGATYKLYIPPDLAYGEKAPSAIGPNATLIFEVHLLEIVRSKSLRLD